MFRALRWVFRYAVILGLIGAALWFGIKGYFTYIHPIAPQVRQWVHTRIQKEHGQYLSYRDIPAFYRTAVISTEDQTFFSNVGVDFRGIARAVLVDLTHGQPAQGGSTITQQLIHDTVLQTEAKSLTWKIHEMVDAVGLCDTMSKQEVFELYANDIYFGQGAYGLYSAAETYFGRRPSQLNDGELAMLAGLPNAPSDYDPFHDLTLARQRQQLVLQSMENNGVLTKDKAQQIFREPIRLKRPSH